MIRPSVSDETQIFEDDIPRILNIANSFFLSWKITEKKRIIVTKENTRSTVSVTFMSLSTEPSLTERSLISLSVSINLMPSALP